jgi:hypothetical protein
VLFSSSPSEVFRRSRHPRIRDGLCNVRLAKCPEARCGVRSDGADLWFDLASQLPMKLASEVVPPIFSAAVRFVLAGLGYLLASSRGPVQLKGRETRHIP